MKCRIVFLAGLVALTLLSFSCSSARKTNVLLEAKQFTELGGWFWESGFDRDPINDMERIRDLNFRAMYGAWDAWKSVDKAAWICVRPETSPRGVYENQLPLLKELMARPGALRREAMKGSLALPTKGRSNASPAGQ